MVLLGCQMITPSGGLCYDINISKNAHATGLMFYQVSNIAGFYSALAASMHRAYIIDALWRQRSAFRISFQA